MFAIEAQQLSKAYRIYANPKDRLKEYLFRGRRCYHQEFWALRDVGFRAGVGSTTPNPRKLKLASSTIASASLRTSADRSGLVMVGFIPIVYGTQLVQCTLKPR